ncbi:hydroxypyruvate isomerase family protein [Aquitalea sp. ASV11]|uniref:hydroxypyruvate isomerase family protein n=1 Tax=Aquitalea sp. ASV11 TaxID=2795103 RepID=UPI0018EC0AED|nr:TIM barrel protein [Aquitalea sp. ASV11]
MLKLCANLSMLFSHLPWPERFAAARAAGFTAVEIQFPYEHTVEQLQDWLGQHQLQLVLINAPAGDLMQGGAGLAGNPGKEAEFASGLQQCLHYATQLGVEAVNILPGRLAEGCSRTQALATLSANLLMAADLLGQHHIRCTVEAINRHDMPGFLVSTLAELQQLPAHPDLFWQIDLYHMASMGEALSPLLATHWQRIGHLQFADYPGRGAPGSGALDFASLFSQIKALPYAFWSGAEYRDNNGDMGWLASLPGQQDDAALRH